MLFIISSMLTRSQIGFYLEDIETPIGRTVNLTLTGLILLSSASFIAETYPLAEAIIINLETLNTALLVVFATEYLVRLWCADNQFNFVFSFFSIVDLVGVIPLLLGFANVSFI
ncbi:Ion transporter, partial [filamentous cyanobacterium Phorm 46]